MKSLSRLQELKEKGLVITIESWPSCWIARTASRKEGTDHFVEFKADTLDDLIKDLLDYHASL